MPQPKSTQLGSFATTGSGTPRAGQVGDHTFTASIVGSGAVSATVLIEASNDAAAWSTISTLTLSGTGTASASATSTSSYLYWRATISAISGGTVNVAAATEEITDASALTSQQKSRLLAVLPGAESLVSKGGILGKQFAGGSRIGGAYGDVSLEAATKRTNHLKIEAEAPFDAVRITVCSTNTSSAANWKGVVAPTATAARTNANTLFRPTQDGATFSTALAAAGTPFGWRAIAFGGAAVGTTPAAASALLPSYLQSDWVACQSVPRIDGGTRPLLMIRLYHDGTVDGSHTIIQGLQPSGGYADQSAKPWYREYQAGNSTSADYVATLTNEPGSLSGSGFWIVVEFSYRGVVTTTVLGIGDSILEANGTQLPGNVYGCYGLRGCALASTPSAPVHWINGGMSSQSSATYFAQGLAALAQFKPSHVLYAAYSPNDATQPAQYETDMMRQRVLQMLAACQAQRTQLLLVTGVPNENHTLASDTARKDLNTWVRNLCAAGAATLVDYGAAVGNGASPELFASGMKFDAVHPSDAAMDIGATLVKNAILATAW